MHTLILLAMNSKKNLEVDSEGYMGQSQVTVEETQVILIKFPRDTSASIKGDPCLRQTKMPSSYTGGELTK